MRNLTSASKPILPSFLFCSALGVCGLPGCSVTVPEGYVSMGGDTGGSTTAPGTSQSSGGSSDGPAATHDGSAIAGGSPSLGGAGTSVGDGTSALEGTAQTAGMGPFTGGATSIQTAAQTGGAGSSSGGAVSIEVGVIAPTCPGTLLTQEQLDAMSDLSVLGPHCAAAQLQGEPPIVNLLLLVDSTHAMTTSVQDTSMTRWDVVEAGINNYVASIHGTSGIGLGFYGATREFTSIPDCEIGAYSSPSVLIDHPDINGATITAALAAMRNTLDRPASLYPALDGSLRYATNWQASNPSERAGVVLITDGRTQVCDKTLQDEYVLEQSYSQTGSSAAIPTFALGVSGDQASLDYLAEGGGTHRAYFVDGPDAPEQLRLALQNVFDTLQATFMEDTGIVVSDPFVMVMVKTSGRGTYLLSEVNSETECDLSTGGWYRKPSVEGTTTVNFCPCSRPNLTKSSVEVRMGCQLAAP